ncbi:MAG: response regulator [Desulfatibacillaceae bacterium]
MDRKNGEAKEKRTILIVDDEPAILECLKRGLRGQGAGNRFMTAVNGEEAVNILAENEVDVMVTDLVMPELDGFGLMEQAAEIRPAMPVVVMSGFMSRENLRRLAATGRGYHAISKPCAMSVLRNTVENAFLTSRKNLRADKTVGDILEKMQLGSVGLTMRVCNGSDEGMMYFYGGELFDALTSRAAGESAAVEILGWCAVEIATMDMCAKGRAIGRSLEELTAEARTRLAAGGRDAEVVERAARLIGRLEHEAARNLLEAKASADTISAEGWLWHSRTARTAHEARDSLERAGALDPHNAVVRSERARLERLWDSLISAPARHCPYCFGMSPSLESRCAHCKGLLRLGENGASGATRPSRGLLSLAAQRLERAVAERDNHRLRYYLAMARLDLGEPRAALRHMRAAVEGAWEKEFFTSQQRSMARIVAQSEDLVFD